MPIVWGGVHPTLLPEQTARHALVDIVVFGEGELSFPPLVNALEKGEEWGGLPGLCFERPDGEVVKTEKAGVPDLDAIHPLPYDLFDLDQYHVGALRSGPSLPIVTSRGCRFRCAYCYIYEFFDRTWRGQSPENVIAELRRLVEKFNAEGVFLLDDFFFQDRKRAAAILQGIIDNDIKVKLYNANCRADFLYRSSDEYLKLMADAGIKTLFVGAESGSAKTLKDMLKDVTKEQILVVNRRLRETGIRAVFSFMAGMPGETEEDVLETLEIMVRLKRENPDAMLYSLCLFVPYPGTPYHDRARELGCKMPETLDEWGTWDFNHVNLTYHTPKFRKFLKKVEDVSAFLDVDGKVGPVLRPLAKAYSGFAAFRVKHHMFGWVPERPLLHAARVLSG
jgi:radical SAM superfamily enzyme YgiQ (UPF0313 family)